MFACYRRDEAHDPDTYCAAVASVLGEYSKAVVDHVTDPRTGLPSDLKWLPSVAEVREACNRRAQQMRNMAISKFERRSAYVPPASHPGCRANVFVHADAPQYPAAYEFACGEHTDPRDWRVDENGRAGVWISLTAWGDLRRHA